MENPWKDTTSERNNGEEIIVATADLKYIKKLLNSKKYPPVDKVDDDASEETKKAAEEKYKLQLSVYPQHFVGNIDKAKIIILSLNPGYSTEYYDAYKNSINKNGTNYEQTIKENLEMEKPFFHAFELANGSDLGYWGNKMKCWVEGYDKKDNEEIALIDLLKRNEVLKETNIDIVPISKEVKNGKKTEYKKITSDEAKKMIETQKVIVVDVRTLEEYNEGHIPNAISVPLETIENKADDNA